MNPETQNLFHQYNAIYPEITEEIFNNSLQTYGDKYLAIVTEEVKKKEQPTEPTGNPLGLATPISADLDLNDAQQELMQQGGVSEPSPFSGSLPQELSTDLPSTETASSGTENSDIPTGQAQSPEGKINPMTPAAGETKVSPAPSVAAASSVNATAAAAQPSVTANPAPTTELEQQLGITPPAAPSAEQSSYQGHNIVKDEEGNSYVDFDGTFAPLEMLPALQTEKAKEAETAALLQNERKEYVNPNLQAEPQPFAQYGVSFEKDTQKGNKDIIALEKAGVVEIKKDTQGNYVYENRKLPYKITDRNYYDNTYLPYIESLNQKVSDQSKEENVKAAKFNYELAKEKFDAPELATPEEEFVRRVYGINGQLLTEDDQELATTEAGRNAIEARALTEKQLKENPKLDYDSAYQENYRKISNPYTVQQYEGAGNALFAWLKEGIETERKLNSSRNLDFTLEESFYNKAVKNPELLQKAGKWMLQEGQHIYGTSAVKFKNAAADYAIRAEIKNEIFNFSNEQHYLDSAFAKRAIDDNKQKVLNAAKEKNQDKVFEISQKQQELYKVIEKSTTKAEENNAIADEWQKYLVERNQSIKEEDELQAAYQNGEIWASSKVIGANTVAGVIDAVKSTVGGVVGVATMPFNSRGASDYVAELTKPTQIGNVVSANFFEEYNDYKLGNRNVQERNGRFFEVGKDGKYFPVQLSREEKQNLVLEKSDREWSVAGVFGSTARMVSEMALAQGAGGVMMNALSKAKYIGKIKAVEQALGAESAMAKSFQSAYRFAKNPTNNGYIGWFTQTYADNIQEGLDNGMSNSKAMLYATIQSGFTGILQRINPDVKFFNSYKTFQQKLVADLSKGNRNGIINGIKSFTSDLQKTFGKEIMNEEIQESVEAVANEMVKVVSTGNLTDQKIDRLDAQGLFDIWIQTAVTVGTVQVGGRIRNGKSAQLAQHEGQVYDLSQMTTGEKYVMLSRLNTDKTFEELRNSFITNKGRIDKVEATVKAIREVSKTIPDAENMSVTTVAAVISRVSQIRQLREQEKTADETFKEGIAARIEVLEQEVSDLISKENEQPNAQKQDTTPAEPTPETVQGEENKQEPEPAPAEPTKPVNPNDGNGAGGAETVAIANESDGQSAVEPVIVHNGIEFASTYDDKLFFGDTEQEVYDKIQEHNRLKNQSQNEKENQQEDNQPESGIKPSEATQQSANLPNEGSQTAVPNVQEEVGNENNQPEITAETAESVTSGNETAQGNNTADDAGAESGTRGVQSEGEAQGVSQTANAGRSEEATEVNEWTEPTELTFEQKKTNHLLDLKQTYNNLSRAKKGQKTGKELLSRMNQVARELGLSLGNAGNGKISIKNPKNGKELGRFRENMSEKIPTEAEFARAKEYINDVILWDGDVYNHHWDAEISWADIRKGAADLQKGKTDTVPARRFTNEINRQLNDLGGLDFKRGSGNIVERTFISIKELEDAKREIPNTLEQLSYLSDETLNELYNERIQSEEDFYTNRTQARENSGIYEEGQGVPPQSARADKRSESQPKPEQVAPPATKDITSTPEYRDISERISDAQKETRVAKEAMEKKARELDKGLLADQEDLFGERATSEEGQLFDERATSEAREKAIKPYKDRYEKAKKEQQELTRQREKLSEGSTTPSMDFDATQEIPKAETKPAPKETKDPEPVTAERETRDAELRKELADAFAEFKDTFKTLNSGVNPETIIKGSKVIGVYLKMGYHKFSDIVQDAHKNLGGITEELLSGLRASYGAFRENASDADFEKMDASTRYFKFSDLENTQETETTTTDERPEPTEGKSPAKPLQGNRKRAYQKKSQKPVQKSDEGGTGRDGRVSGNELSETDAGINESTDGAGNVLSGHADVLGDKTKKPAEKKENKSPQEVVDEINEAAEQQPALVEFNLEDQSAGKFRTTEKLQDNINALKALVAILGEKRKATPVEKELLSKYAGFGGLKEILNDPSDNTVWKNKTHQKQVKEIVSLTTELNKLTGARDTLAELRGGTLNAHYTPKNVIDAMYKGIEQLGFKGGKVLEPSAGIGNFLGFMPNKLSNKSNTTAVELDTVTGNILKSIYSDADVKVTGIQDANIPNNSQDLIISNIPFGNYRVYDKNFKGKKAAFTGKIHNYFFAKAIDQAREGGVIAFVTSKGVLDSPSNEALRKYLDENANFLGAIRLPNTTFANSANTAVVTDIIFLQKNTKGERNNADFVGTSAMDATHKDGASQQVMVNNYFHENPQNILGEIEAGGMYSRNDYTVNGDAEALLQRIQEMLPKNIMKQVSSEMGSEANDNAAQIESVKEGNIAVIDGKVVKKENGLVSDHAFPSYVKDQTIQDYIKLRDTLNEIIYSEYLGDSDLRLNAQRRQLNELYDKVHSQSAAKQKEFYRVAKDDNDGFNVVALTKPDGTKADIFSKRTIQPVQQKTKAASVDEAIVISLYENARLDIDRIAELLETSVHDVLEQAKGKIFENPTGGFETRDEYLSGNVKQKLQEAQAAVANGFGNFQQNVDALLPVIPKDIPSTLIEARMGSRWIPTDVFEEFGKHILKDKYFSLTYVKTTDSYATDGKSTTVEATKKYGTQRRNGAEIILDALHLKPPVVKDKDIDGKTVVNKEETQKALEKYEEVREVFDDWVHRSPERRERLGRIYNDTYNTTIKREYDGSHLNIAGINGIQLYPHQKDAIWMLLQNNGGIIDHIVGAGKTFVMVAGTMEMKRTGVANKPMIIALKSTIPQIVESYKKAYPMARVLAPTEKDFTKDNRKKLFAQIANNEWDVVIMTHENYGKIPQDPEFIRKQIEEEMDELNAEREDLKGNKKALQGLERRLKNLQARLEKLADRETDNTHTFQMMGIDHIMVDESQQFKNLAYTTKQTSVAGLSKPEGSSRSFNLFTGMRYLQEKLGGDRGTTFLSGTPISNSMVEMYLLLKYMRPTRMKELGLESFDQWATTFASPSNDIEFTVTGEFKNKLRFREFINVPELSILYNEIADVRNDDNLVLDKPKMAGDTYTFEVTPMSDAQLDYAERLVKFAKEKDGSHIGVTLSEEQKSAVMLMTTTLAAKMAIDMRLIDGGYDYDPNGKIGQLVNNVAKLYQETNDYKGTQLIFSDIGTPKSASKTAQLRDFLEDELAVNPDDITEIFGDINEEGYKTKPYNAKLTDKIKEVLDITQDELDDYVERAQSATSFNVYAETKLRLVEQGIPAEQIAFIHDYQTQKKKDELFKKVNEGEVRIVLGSTQKLGTGVNAQRRIVAIHHLDVPWRPSDMEQRNGRGLRQGNQIAKEHRNNEVGIFAYATERTLDAFKYGLLQTKQRFLDQVKSGNVEERSIQEGDEESGMLARIVAELSGNKDVLAKSQLEQQTDKLKKAKRNFDATLHDAESNIVRIESFIPNMKENIAKTEQDVRWAENLLTMNEEGKFIVDTVNGKPVAATIDEKQQEKIDKDRAKAKKEGKPFEEPVLEPSRSDLGKAIIASIKEKVENLPLEKEVVAATVNDNITITAKKVEVTEFVMSKAVARVETQLAVLSPSGAQYRFNYSESGGIVLNNIQKAITDSIPSRLNSFKAQLAKYEKDLKGYQEIAAEKEFPKQAELDKVATELKEVNKRLESTADSNQEQDSDDNATVDYAQAPAGKSSGKKGDTEQKSDDQEANAQKLTDERIKPEQRPQTTSNKKLDEMIKDVADALSTTLIYGKAQRNALGTYSPSNTLVRIRNAGDVDTVAHELGHFIDDKYNFLSEASKAGTAIDRELSWFEKRGGSNPPSRLKADAKREYRKREGLAEFVRAYVVNNPEAKRIAPNLHREFENKMPQEVKAALRAFGEDIVNLHNATYGEKIDSNIQRSDLKDKKAFLDFKNKTDALGFTVWDNINVNLFDSSAKAKKAFKFITKLKGDTKLLPEKDFGVLHRVFAGVNGKIDDVLRNGMVDSRNNRIYDSKGDAMTMEWLLAPLDGTSEQTVRDDMQETIRLLIAQRTIEYSKKFGRDDKLSGTGAGLETDLDVARGYIKEFTASATQNPQRHARIIEAARRYREYADAGLRYAVGAGRLSETAYENIKADNQYYVNMARVIQTSPSQEEEAYFGESGKVTSAKDIFKRAKGGVDMIRNPYESLLMNTANIIKEADRNKIMVSFIEPLKNVRKMGEGEPVNFAQIATPAMEGDANATTIYINGVKERWRMSEDVAQAFNDLNTMAKDGLLEKIGQLPAKIIRFTVTNFPTFAARNVTRDTLSRVIMSRSNSGLKDLIYNSSDAEMFALYGGSLAGYYGGGREVYTDHLNRAIKDISGSGKGFAINPMRIARGYHKLLQGSENVNRIAEFKGSYRKAKKEGLDDYNAGLYAAFQARDLMDFAVAGTAIRQLNKYIPFLNAGVQGAVRVKKSVTEKPLAWAVKTSIYTILPTLIARALVSARGDDDDYEQLPDYMRDLFWNFRTPLTGDSWISIPKPYENGAVSALVDRAISAVLGNEEAFEGMTGSVVKTLVPVDEASLLGGMKPIVENMVNYDFFREKTIVSPWEEGKDREFRNSDKSASATSQKLTQVMNDYLGYDANPHKVDHLIQGYGTYMGRFALKAADIGVKDSRFDFDITDSGFAKRNQLTNSKSVAKAYELAKRYGKTQDAKVKGLGKMIRDYYLLEDDAQKQKQTDAIYKEAKEVTAYLKEMPSLKGGYSELAKLRIENGYSGSQLKEEANRRGLLKHDNNEAFKRKTKEAIHQYILDKNEDRIDEIRKMWSRKQITDGQLREAIKSLPNITGTSAKKIYKDIKG